jgi:hypothetical protein
MEKQKEDWDEKFRKLYDESFEPIKAQYDLICKIFFAWNTGRIDSETAYIRLKSIGRR